MADTDKDSDKKVTVPKEFESLVKELDKLSALEISKFVKFLEEYWGVSAAAPAAAAAAAAAGDAALPKKLRANTTSSLRMPAPRRLPSSRPSKTLPA